MYDLTQFLLGILIKCYEKLLRILAMPRFSRETNQETTSASRNIPATSSASGITSNAPTNRRPSLTQPDHRLFKQLVDGVNVEGFAEEVKDINACEAEEYAQIQYEEINSEFEELAKAAGDYELIAEQARSVNCITTVVVGKEKVEFLVPTKLLRHRSPFFKAACSEKWESGQSKVIELDEELPLAFLIYLKWMYLGRISSLRRTSKMVRTNAMKWYINASCWILGDYVLDHEFCTVMIEVLMADIRKCHLNTGTLCFMNGAVITDIYEKTGHSSSPLRRLMVDSWTAIVKPDDAKAFMLANKSSQCQEFYAEVMHEMTTLERGQVPWEASPCHYHNHDSLECPVALVAQS
jgi:hypothetical protein